MYVCVCVCVCVRNMHKLVSNLSHSQASYMVDQILCDYRCLCVYVCVCVYRVACTAVL